MCLPSDTSSPPCLAAKAMTSMPPPPPLKTADASPTCVGYMSKRRSPCRKDKSVAFHPQVIVRPYACALSQVDYHADLLWYSQEEFAAIKDKNRAQIGYVLSQKGDCSTRNGKRFCIRGLEKYLNAKYHWEVRDTARKAVLLEQRLQFSSDGCLDEEKLAAIYKMASEGCQTLAAEQGARDAKEARRYHGNMSPQVAEMQLQDLRRKHCVLQRRDSLQGLY